MNKNSPKNKNKTDKKRSSAAIAPLLVVVTLAVLMMTSSSLGVTTHFADASIANNLPNLAINPSSTSMYKDSIGNIHIVGELQNNFRYPINFVQVIATLYDASKQVVGT